MKNAALLGGISACRKRGVLAPRIYEGGARRAGESEYLLGKYSKIARFSVKSGQTPSDPAAPGFARFHRATSPINGGGKGFSTV